MREAAARYYLLLTELVLIWKGRATGLVIYRCTSATRVMSTPFREPGVNVDPSFRTKHSRFEFRSSQTKKPCSCSGSIRFEIRNSLFFYVAIIAGRIQINITVIVKEKLARDMVDVELIVEPYI